MADESFGKPIDRATADAYFSRYVGIKQRCMPTFRQVLAADPEARRYYCGDDAGDAVPQDWAFVFDKACLQRIMDNMGKLGADCIFIFHAAKGPQSDAKAYAAQERSVQSEATTDAGRPTLMIFPAKYHDGVADGAVEFEVFNDDGEQYPGNGGGTLVAGDPVTLPGNFTKGQYHV